MQNRRCFLCGHKMLENGLCSNSNCVRSQNVGETKNTGNKKSVSSVETPETQAESVQDA